MRECQHVKALREFLDANQMRVYSEHGEDPYGWVNVHCPACQVTFEISLLEPEEVEVSDARNPEPWTNLA